jgi:hypothetical protein
MKKTLTKKAKAEVRDLVDGIMNAPADDELVAAFFQAYRQGVAADNLPADPKLEAEVRAHLRGTKYESLFDD